MGTPVPPVPFGIPAELLEELEQEHGDRARLLVGIKSELTASVSRMQRNLINNREMLYGLLPIRAEVKQWRQRRKAEFIRAKHSVFNPSIGEKLRPVCCLRCARHVSEWEGPEEGVPAACVEVGGRIAK